MLQGTENAYGTNAISRTVIIIQKVPYSDLILLIIVYLNLPTCKEKIVPSNS